MAEDPIDKARAAMNERVELPGMTLMEHLEELRKRLMGAIISLFVGVGLTSPFYKQLINLLQKPLTQNGLAMNMSHPTDAIELIVKTVLVAGAILASPAILYQLWLFIAPGLYANEKKYVFPFMGSTVGLFLGGAWFGYRWVLPDAIKVLVLGFGKNFTHVISIDEYTSFFLSLILGLGICFELPILMFFVALFGLVDHKFFLKQWRYAVLAVFLVAAFLCPDPTPVGMCIFAMPMLLLYVVGVIAAYFVNPERRKAKENKDKELTAA